MFTTRHLFLTFTVMMIFSARIPAQTLTTLYDFGGASTAPAGLTGPLVRATDGNFYGATAGGGAGAIPGGAPIGYGTIFKMTPGGNVTVIYSLCSNGETTLCVSTGATPSGLIQASDGNFYGTTQGGGTYQAGTVFRVTPAGVFTVLHSFCQSCNEGTLPNNSLVQGADGSLYGTTAYGSDGAGGMNPYGSIYKVTLSGALTTLHTFCPNGSCTDGQQPSAPLVVGSDGNLYGVTAYGGLDYSFNPNGYLGAGTLYKITPSGSFNLLHQFCSNSACEDGTGPNSLVLGTDGAIYGTTGGVIYDSSGNLVGEGTAFKITTTGVFTALHTFCTQSGCPDGGEPRGGLLQAKDGDFYGTTYLGGANDSRGLGGTVFRMTTGGIVSTLYSFCAEPGGVYCLDGFWPTLGLTQGLNGLLYGSTSVGGTNGALDTDYGYGTIFSMSLPPVPGKSVSAGARDDYLGEGKSGYTVWRPTTGYWYSTDSTGKKTVTGQWGEPTDLPVIGDFDGDGKSDFAIFRPATGFWYIKRSSDQQVQSQQWGLPTDLPVAGDFDGDGKTDLAVFRPSSGDWYISQSSNGAIVTKQWGELSDAPVVGDFDGDGKSDVAVFRPSTGYWYILQSSNGAVLAKQWGLPSDVPVTGDFDGDGKTDIAVYRPSTGYWYIIQSSNGEVVAKQWGEVGDVPVARDYDGDGKTDIAVWRPSSGYWYVIESSSGQTLAYQWGEPTDIPVNSLAH